MASKKDYVRAAAIVRVVSRNQGPKPAIVAREAFKLLFWNEPAFDHGRFNAACEDQKSTKVYQDLIDECEAILAGSKAP